MNARAQEMLHGWQRGVEEALQRVWDGMKALGGAATAEIPAPPPKGATPEQYAAYLSTLNEEQLRTVGNTDGFAAELRDQANRILMKRELEYLPAEIARERAEAAAAQGPGGEAERLTSEHRAGQLEARLSGLETLYGRIGDRTAGGEGLFLLRYDSADNRAIVATHNPDTAGHVATFVPGAQTDLERISGTIDRIERMEAAATQVPGTAPTSVIAWVDYPSPESFQVGADYHAYEGRDELDSFQDGLRTAHIGETPSHNTVVGYSYGSLVAGMADRDMDLDVDDFVSVGGIGVGTSHAQDLNTPVDHVWATENSLDDLADVGRDLGLRSDPAGQDFGSQVFDSNSPVPLDDIPHNQYFTPHPENPGLNNIGNIIAGREPTRP